MPLPATVVTTHARVSVHVPDGSDVTVYALGVSTAARPQWHSSTTYVCPAVIVCAPPHGVPPTCRWPADGVSGSSPKRHASGPASEYPSVRPLKGGRLRSSSTRHSTGVGESVVTSTATHTWTGSWFVTAHRGSDTTVASFPG